MYMLRHKNEQSFHKIHLHREPTTKAHTHTHTHTRIYTARHKRIHDLNITLTEHQRATSEQNSVTQNKGREHVKI